MPSTIVHIGFAFLIVAGLLGKYYGWKALALLVAVLVIVEVDTILGWYIDGAHRALTHNLLLPAVAALVLFLDMRRGENSWIRSRWGRYGLWIAWVVLFGHVFAHILLDMAHLDGINPLYPVYDRFVRLDGEIYYSSTHGFVQTFIDTGPDPDTGQLVIDVGQQGTTADTHVSSPVDPSPPAGPAEPIDRRFPVAVQGWQLYLILVGMFVVVAKHLQRPLDTT